MNVLTDHRIATIRGLRSRNRYPRLVGRNSPWGIHGYGADVLLVELTTDQGAAGFGWSAATAETVAPFKGRRLSDLFDPTGGIVDPAARAIEFPLYDLGGKVLNLCGFELLGGGKRRENPGPLEFPCYDGAIYLDDISPAGEDLGIEPVLANCRSDYDAGYRDFKLKIGRGFRWMAPEEGTRRDAEVTRAVRESFPDARILVDANNGLTVESLTRYLEDASDCDLYWIEEPFHENREVLLRLKDVLARLSPRTKIADGEYQPDVEQVISLAAEGLIDVVLMDVAGFGITNWRNVIGRIRETRATVSPHAWALKMKTCYAAQCAAAWGSADLIEGVFGETEGIDLDAAYPLRDGVLRVPRRPGWGMDLIWAKELWSV
jgi:L-alanine-DL-glutamate epimerase-like enolase superfamily enzyme